MRPAIKAEVDKEYRQEIGERLRMARKRLSMTLESVAGECAVSRQTVVAWETGRSFPSAEHLAHLVVLYHVSADWILGLGSYGHELGEEDELFISDYLRAKPHLQGVARRVCLEVLHSEDG